MRHWIRQLIVVLPCAALLLALSASRPGRTSSPVRGTVLPPMAPPSTASLMSIAARQGGIQANRGQAPPDARFLDQTARGTWLFTSSGVAVALHGSPSRTVELRFRPVGGHLSAPVASGRLPGTVNYLLGNDPHRWRTAISTYAAVDYRSVYPGVDLRFQANGAGVEYRWVVRPGANPAQIALAVEGAQRLQLTPNGSLLVDTPAGDLRGSRPIFSQPGVRYPVAGRYHLDRDGVIHLAVGRYDHKKTLIVDPTLTVMAVFGGSLDDAATSVAVDGSGNTFITGYTASSDFPVTAPLQSHFAGSQDAFIAKLDPTGKVIYRTYLGGNGSDTGLGIAVDAAGEPVIAGATNSSTFPVTPEAIQSTWGGGTCPAQGFNFACEDAFVAKLNASGSGLLFSTYLGGKAEDYAAGIALDAAGDPVITGATGSKNFPLKAPIERTFHGGICGLYSAVYPCNDVFVAKLNPTGTDLIFSTYLGGTDADLASAVALDQAGRIAVTGSTYSVDFPVVHGRHRKAPTHCKIHLSFGRCPHAFVSVLAPTGASLAFSTYLGGSDIDNGQGITTDAHGNIYVVGDTTSADFPSLHPVQPAHRKDHCKQFGVQHPCSDAFIVKLSGRTGKVLYSSHFGGTVIDGADAVAADASGNAYVAGYAGSYNFPILHAIQKQNGGGYDVFVLELTPSGGKAYYSTYLGGERDDFGRAIALRRPGEVVVVGDAESARFPRTSPYGPAKKGIDAFALDIQTGNVRPARLPCLLLYGEKGTGCLH